MPYVASGATVIIWSSSFPAVKYVLDYYSPGALMLFRFLIASALLMGYCVIKKVPPPHKKALPLFIMSGFIGLFLYMWTFNTGADMVISGISSFIISSAPVYTLILSVIFLKEKAGLMTWAGVIISFLGLAAISATEITDMQLNIGIWILLIAALTTSIYNIFQKMILRKYSVMQATAYPIAFGTLFMLIFLPEFLYEFPEAPMRANVIVIYLAVFPAALAYFLWGYALAAVEKVIYVTSFLYLTPFLSSVLGFFWLGETMPALAILGGVVVVVGMVVTNFRRV